MTETPGQKGELYNANEVYKAAFGYVRPPYPNLVLQSKTLGISPVGTLKALSGVFNLKSKLGAEYTMPTAFKFIGKNGLEETWQVPQEPTLSIKGSKNIIETPLNQGSRGVRNVIEEVNLNNYQIRMRGTIINENDYEEYPVEAIGMLRHICEMGGDNGLKIVNDLTSIWNISRVIVRDWDLFEVKGYKGAQAFELDMLTDEDIELENIDSPERL